MCVQPSVAHQPAPWQARRPACFLSASTHPCRSACRQVEPGAAAGVPPEPAKRAADRRAVRGGGLLLGVQAACAAVGGIACRGNCRRTPMWQAMHNCCAHACPSFPSPALPSTPLPARCCPAPQLLRASGMGDLPAEPLWRRPLPAGGGALAAFQRECATIRQALDGELCKVGRGGAPGGAGGRGQ